MPKAKTIDRLALTKRNSFFLRERDNESIKDIPPDIDIHKLGDVCPLCHQHTLIHESGCVKCPSCLWSACG